MVEGGIGEEAGGGVGVDFRSEFVESVGVAEEVEDGDADGGGDGVGAREAGSLLSPGGNFSGQRID